MVQAQLVCQLCGQIPDSAQVDAALLSWSMNRCNGLTRWTCPDCVLTNIRSVEAKLELEWW